MCVTVPAVYGYINIYKYIYKQHHTIAKAISNMYSERKRNLLTIRGLIDFVIIVKVLFSK